MAERETFEERLTRLMTEPVPTTWDQPTADPLASLTAFIDRCRADYSKPPVGHPDNPYVVVAPRWMQAQAEAEGTTLQEVADRIFRYATRVEIVDPL